MVNPALPFKFRVVGIDNYFTGLITDTIGTMTYQLSAPRFSAGTGYGVPVGFSAVLRDVTREYIVGRHAYEATQCLSPWTVRCINVFVGTPE